VKLKDEGGWRKWVKWESERSWREEGGESERSWRKPANEKKKKKGKEKRRERKRREREKGKKKKDFGWEAGGGGEMRWEEG